MAVQTSSTGRMLLVGSPAPQMTAERASFFLDAAIKRRKIAGAVERMSITHTPGTKEVSPESPSQLREADRERRERLVSKELSDRELIRAHGLNGVRPLLSDDEFNITRAVSLPPTFPSPPSTTSERVGCCHSLRSTATSRSSMTALDSTTMRSPWIGHARPPGTSCRFDHEKT